jgi:hypothetical protein
MKIDLDLDEIFDEGENVDDSIKERIIQTVTNRIYAKIERDVSGTVDEIVKNGVKEKIYSWLADAIPGLMDYEFQQTDMYGATRGEKTTVRNRILQALQTECVYKESRSGYSSEHNAFTNAMKNIIAEQMNKYIPQFDKEINALFIKEAMKYAQESLQKRLGLK